MSRQYPAPLPGACLGREIWPGSQPPYCPHCGVPADVPHRLGACPRRPCPHGFDQEWGDDCPQCMADESNERFRGNRR